MADHLGRLVLHVHQVADAFGVFSCHLFDGLLVEPQHLLGTLEGGQNGSTTLNSTTVFDDGVADSLNSATGGGDW